MRYVENETEIEVTIEGLPVWDGEPSIVLVTYPSGRRYAMRCETVGLHFTQVPNQSAAISGTGGGAYDRPTRKQQELAHGNDTRAS